MRNLTNYILVSYSQVVFMIYHNDVKEDLEKMQGTLEYLLSIQIIDGNLPIFVGFLRVMKDILGM